MNKSRSQRIVLLLDCCHSGAFTKGGKSEGADAEKILDEQLGGRGRAIITAADSREYAYESEFTDAVVRGLETGDADRDGDGWVSVEELYSYVYSQVRQNRRDQTPIKSFRIAGELRLARNPHNPLPLPPEFDAILASETALIRLCAIDGLGRLLAGDHPGGQKRAARRALVRLRDEDPDSDVREAARKALLPPDIADPPHQGHRRWVKISLIPATVLLSVALILMAYVIYDDEVSTAKPAACSPKVKTADGMLALGTLLPETGASVYSGPAMDAGVDLAMKDINDAGGIPRIAVQLDGAKQQDEGNPSGDTASQSTDALLAGGVDAIIGPATSAAARKVIDKVACAGVIMFSPSNASPLFTTYPDRGLYFRTMVSSVLGGPVLGKLVVDDGNSTVVVMSRDDVYGNPLRETAVKAIQEYGGQVLDSFHYSPDALDHGKEIQRVKDKNPDAIVLIGFTESAKILTGMIKEDLGPRSKRVYASNMTNIMAGQVDARDPGVLAGMKGTQPYAGDEAFVKRLTKASPGLRDRTYAAQAYDAVVITVLAAAIAGTDEPAAISKQINGVTKTGEKCTIFAACLALVKDRKDIDYDGPSGPLEFADPGEPSSATYVISEMQPDGTVKPLRSERAGPPN